MSGGFFRGTSAEQDTRFSNKQAKLLKSQKFAPELDHPVDMTKVNMDVIKPWIATRATELLGFEDEVLINFVYGLLDGKDVDGKQIQIQLTGFMEKNTGKFMRELWALLLSAQNNVSGVPQQFLDAKEEELKKKKEENDRITQEIQKRKEKDGRDLEEERQKRMDEEMDNAKAAGSVSKHSLPRSSNIKPDEERDLDRMREPRTRSRQSPPSRSPSKSVSKSRSSRELRRSRSASVSSGGDKHSVSPKRQTHSSHRRSVSVERRFRSPRRSASPRRRYSPRGIGSPLRRRSPYSRRRKSPSISRHRSPSPTRRRSRSPIRSPVRRRSPSPIRKRSPSPIRRRSPFSRRRSPYGRRRSPSPLYRRSPVKSHRRSPSPPHYRSPVRRKFSSGRRRSPSPAKRSSPLQRSPRLRRRSPSRSPKTHGADARRSPLQRSPGRRRNSPKIHGADSRTSPRMKRNRSPFRSPSPPSHRSSSRETDNRTNGFVTKGHHNESTPRRTRESAALASNRSAVEHVETRHKLSGVPSRQLRSPSRSPLRKSMVQNDIDNRDQYAESDNSQSLSESPRDVRKRNPRRLSPVKFSGKQTPLTESPGIDSEDEQFGLTREDKTRRRGSSQNKNKDLGDKNQQTSSKEKAIDGSLEDNSSPERLDHRDYSDSRKKERERKRSDTVVEKEHIQQVSKHREEVEYGPGRRTRGDKHSLEADYDRQCSSKKDARTGSSRKDVSDEHMAGKPDVEKQPNSKADTFGDSYNAKDASRKSKGKTEQNSDLNITDSDSDRGDAHKSRTTEKRKHKKSSRHRRDSDLSSGSDSETEDKKEAKRRRKEEKRLRKEDKRRRREEKHRKRLEHSSSKVNVKPVYAVTPPDFERDRNDAGTSEDEAATRKGTRPHYTEESEQKKLEIELREKALETLRAKKAVNH